MRAALAPTARVPGGGHGSDSFVAREGVDEGRDSIARATKDALELGEDVGRGSFCVVRRCVYRGRSYVVKLPRQDVGREKREEAAADLRNETALLLTMTPHANVVRCVAVPDASDGDPFLVLEHVPCPFASRFAHWQREAERLCSLSGATLLARVAPCLRCCKARARSLWYDRLAAARDLATALWHLHEAAVAPDCVIYRDLKPSNLGFDVCGRLVLYDLGLAKLLPKAKRAGAAADPFQLTGGTGSRRYMAPEVALYRPYDESADLYSYGLILWQLFALQKPFEGFDVAELVQRVVKDGERPRVEPHWPEASAELIVACWSIDPRARPTADFAIETLNHELALAAL